MRSLATCACTLAVGLLFGCSLTAPSRDELGGECSHDLKTDRDHCGVCNHRCGGGDCKDGLCQPVQVLGPQQKPRGLALDSENLYFLTGSDAQISAQGRLLTLALTSGAGAVPEPLLDGNVFEPKGLAFSSTQFLWCDQGNPSLPVPHGELRGLPRSGGTKPLSVFGDTTFLYDPYGIAVVESEGQEFAYFTQNKAGGNISQVHPGDASTVRVIVPQLVDPRGVATSGDLIYWTEWGPSGADKSGSVSSRSISDPDATMTVIAGSQSEPCGVAIDEKFVYWANQGDGTLMRAPITGGIPVTIVSEQSQPEFVAIDAVSIYWTNSGDGTIWRVAK